MTLDLFGSFKGVNMIVSQLNKCNNQKASKFNQEMPQSQTTQWHSEEEAQAMDK